MATLAGITIVRRFDYRDITQEEFSNQYWFKAPPPTNESGWTSWVSVIVGIEQTIYPPTVEFVRAYGYNDDASDANHVYAKDWTVPGPPPTGGMVPGTHVMAGDQAALVAWKTDHVNKRGKPIYLRKYIHAGLISASDHDAIEPGYHSILTQYADQIRLLNGGLTNPSSENWPGGSHTAMLTTVSPWVTTRTLRRRGPRPKTGA